ncbi:hypothetical protein M0P48_01230 [Candidatus Gracilibacteria bacterium]|jgi:hypothetical protein|nr:hypothetical protein [Candidatus Gracilibacteria bacterium]
MATSKGGPEASLDAINPENGFSEGMQKIAQEMGLSTEAQQVIADISDRAPKDLTPEMIAGWDEELKAEVVRCFSRRVNEIEMGLIAETMMTGKIPELGRTLKEDADLNALLERLYAFLYKIALMPTHSSMMVAYGARKKGLETELARIERKAAKKNRNKPIEDISAAVKAGRSAAIPSEKYQH